MTSSYWVAFRSCDDYSRDGSGENWTRGASHWNPRIVLSSFGALSLEDIALSAPQIELIAGSAISFGSCVSIATGALSVSGNPLLLRFGIVLGPDNAAGRVIEPILVFVLVLLDWPLVGLGALFGYPPPSASRSRGIRKCT